MAVTQKSYVDDSSSVKAARKKLDKAAAELADAKKAKAGLPSNAGERIAAQIESRILEAQKKVDAQKLAVTQIETKAKDYFAKNEAAIQEKAAAKKTAASETNIASAQAQLERMKAAGLDTTQIQASIDRAKGKKDTAEVPVSGAGDAGTEEQKPEDFAGLLKTAPDFVRNMSGPNRKLLATKLNEAFGLKIPVVEVYTDALTAAYQSAISGAQGRYNQFKDIFTVDQYLAEKALETAAIKAAGGDGTKYDPYGTLSVWDKVKTKSELTTLFDNLGLDRDPTDKEVNDIYAQLDKKQKEQKATVTKYKVINGVRTAVTTPGFNQAEFITGLVKGSQEYKDIVAKKAKQEESKNLVASNTLKSIADKNGITLSPEQLTTFADRVKKGEDISLVQNDIRKLAAIGQPENIKKLIDSGIDLSTIYDPYKKLMGSVLEINPNSIPLNDPTLRMAIGPEKEMSLYEYQRALRKDNRWQYTDQARTEASDVAKTVLKDFGFMG